VRVLVVSTYELGRQPTSAAEEAARLRAEGHDVRVVDVAVQPWDPAAAAWADEVAFSVPMHTATRLARDLAVGVDRPVRFFGLYAAMAADLGPAESAPAAPVVPARDLLPSLDRYAQLVLGDERRPVGSVDASRGCAHRCRHCPVPVVADGRVQRVPVEMVMADVDALVGLGARHITFGDPDFLNAPPHSRRVVDALHRTFPDVTFDCTVKVEHVLRHADLWHDWAAAGLLFAVSAFESTDDAVLARLDKGHTATDAARAVEVLRAAGVDVRPSFMPFTPWTTRQSLVDLLDFVHRHDLVDCVDPVQYTIRLLLPQGSLLLGHPDLAPYLGEWDGEQLSFRWHAADPAMDALRGELAALVEADVEAGIAGVDTYARVRAVVGASPVEVASTPIPRPHLTESWFCCAEPTSAQRVQLPPLHVASPGCSEGN